MPINRAEISAFFRDDVYLDLLLEDGPRVTLEDLSECFRKFRAWLDDRGATDDEIGTLAYFLFGEPYVRRLADLSPQEQADFSALSAAFGVTFEKIQ